jgi:protein disulfide-isomerase
MTTRSFASLLFVFALTLNSAFALAPAGWTEDYAKAVEKAKAEKKNILLDFTGSDWCGYCMALDKEVFATPKFKTWAKQNVILVKVDFPQGIKQTAKVKEQNEGLKTKYPVSGYPMVLIVDSEGKVLVKQGGYSPGSGPAKYIEALSAGTVKK